MALTPEDDLSERLDRVHEPHRASGHALENFEAAPDLSRKRSALRAFLSAGAEFTWVMKAQLQGVLGSHDAYVEWWDRMAAHLKADPVARFLWKLRTTSSHEGVLVTRPALIPDMSRAEAEALLADGAEVIAFGVDSWVFIDGTPEPFDTYPASSLMIHWRNLMTEVLMRVVHDLEPERAFFTAAPDGSEVRLDIETELARVRALNAAGPRYPAPAPGRGPRGGFRSP